MPVHSSTGRPNPMVLETGDILWFPEFFWVTNIHGASFRNRLWPFGHIAMVFFKDEKEKDTPDHPVAKDHPRAIPYVVEAVKNAKNPNPLLPRISQVREISYDSWFPDFDTFWHGRIQKPSAGGPVALLPAEQMALVTEALRYLGKPYSSWRQPSLNRYKWFSCSKLILVAAYNALGITLDGIPGPERRLPCQAKSLKKSSHIS